MHIKSFIKRYSEYLLPILVSLLIIFIYLLINDFYIEDSLLINDLESQYIGLMQYLKNVFEGKDSILYSFSKGLGGNMASTIAYYLTSPLNLLVLFFDNVAVAISIGILLRFCFCNLTAYIFFRHKYNTTKFNTLIFSTIYAFSGYIINYYFNIMWIDIVILLPLILLQLDKLIDGKKNILIILMALSLIISFYLSYMVVIFIYIYIIYELILKKKSKQEIKRILIKLSISVIIAFLLSSFILLPTVLDIKNNIFRYASEINIFDIDFAKIKMIISKLYIGTIDDISRFSGNEANIYFTIFGLVLLIKYFLNTKISKNEKICSFIIIIIFICSILFDFLNLAWHGLSLPNGYNYRFSFLFILFIIILIFKQFINNEKLSKKQLIIINSIFIIISLFMINAYSYLTITKIVVTVIFFIIYTLLLNNPNKILIIVVLLELIINLNYSLLTREALNYTHFRDYNYLSEACDMASYSKTNQRIALTHINYANDAFTCNINDVVMTMSTNSELYFEFMSNVGYSVTYSTLMQNLDIGPFISSILGIEQIISEVERNDSYYDLKSLQQVLNVDYYKLFYEYNNINALQIGYIIENSDISYSNNPFENQNNLAKQMSGIDVDIFEQVTLTKIQNNKYRFETNEDTYYFYNYFPIPINYIGYMGVYINGNKIDDINSFNKGIHQIALEEKEANILSIEVYDEEYEKYINPLLYTFNEENYQKIMDRLKQKQLNVSYFDNNKLNGIINSEKDETLMLSIPYEKGWIIKINGERVNYKKVYDAFIGIDLKAGTNKIEMVFIPPGMILGSLLSFVGIILTYVYSKYNKKA